MADLYSQAKQEADATAQAKIAAYDAEKKAALDTYTLARQQWDSGRKAAIGTMQGQQEDERARNANRMAARGIGAGEGAVVNYGRLNAQHEGQLAGVERDYGDNLGKISLAYQNAQTEIGGKESAARAQAEADTLSIYRQYQEAEAQAAATRARYSGSGSGGSSADTGPKEAAFAVSAWDKTMTYDQYATAAIGAGYDPTKFKYMWDSEIPAPAPVANAGAGRPLQTGAANFVQKQPHSVVRKPATNYIAQRLRW